MKTPQRIALYLFGFAVPPGLAAMIMSLAAVSSVMVHKTPKPLPGGESLPPPPTVASGDSNQKMTALVVVSNQGTELLDLLATVEVLGASGAFRIVTAAQSRTLSPTTGALAILPHVDFENAPKPDLLVVPAVLDPANPSLVARIRELSQQAKLILTVCEGARLMAQAGVLEGKSATSHFIALPELKESHPSVSWKADERVVESGNIVTTAGITASMDGALRAIERLAGPQVARDTALHIGIAQETGRTLALDQADYARLALYAGFDWRRKYVAVFVFPGVSELSLAAYLNILPRAMSVRAFSFAAERRPIESKYGLVLVPDRPLSEAAFPDVVVIPSGLSPDGSNRAPPLPDEMTSWIQTSGIPLEDRFAAAPGSAIETALARVAELTDSAMAGVVAKLVEHPQYPAQNGGSKASAHLTEGVGWPFRLWYRIVLLGVLGVFAARMLERRISRRQSP